MVQNTPRAHQELTWTFCHRGSSLHGYTCTRAEDRCMHVGFGSSRACQEPHCRLGLRSLRAYSGHVRSQVDPTSGLHVYVRLPQVVHAHVYMTAAMLSPSSSPCIFYSATGDGYINRSPIAALTHRHGLANPPSRASIVPHRRRPPPTPSV